ncbi:hypothetical protein [Anaeromyxobacter sp. SG66]|uniref:hypothetical protein n=1 Tax=Anaeromyxobacter sp. SG66 TaxID=2925410 RepID=UPI001F566CAB|nr:hypothetical protein [Anaeromyxobacter sp. SG66]
MQVKIMVVVAVLLASAGARADDAAPATPAPASAGKSDAPAAKGEGEAATKEEVKALAEELRRLKLEMGLKDVEYASYAGMGPAASKVYFAPKGLSIGGYGELFYRNRLSGGPSDSDLYRVILYTGYRFTPKILFNAEIEYEHQHELSVEFAYLDFLLSDAVGVRVGNVLVPMGFLNELHEPPFFNGVFRPEVERNLIPSTWNENGLGVHGAVGPVRYKAYALVGLNGQSGDLSSGSWLRGARTGGGEAPAESFAGVASVGYARGPLDVAGSVYRGRAGQGAKDAEGTIRADVTLAEAHAQLAWRGLQLRGLYAMGWLDDAGRLSALQGGGLVLGSRTRGGYVEAAYDVLAVALPELGQSLSPFVRYEALDLHDRVPAGFARDAALDEKLWTAGLTYKPIPNVVVKADYQRTDTEADTTADQVNLGVGYVF